MQDLLTFGTDPEFLVWDYNAKQYKGASNYFPAHSSVRVASKAVLKCDGADFTGEIECPPFTSPEAGVALLKDALRELVSRNLDFVGGCCILTNRSGSDGTPIGGHIHFAMRPTNDFLTVLDKTIGTLSYLVDDPGMILRHKGGRYGAYWNTSNSSVEFKPHGFEYRTPPSWLISEEWCLCFLSVAWMVAHTYLRDAKGLINVCNKFDKHSNKAFRLKTVFGWIRETHPDIYLSKALAPLWRIVSEGKTWGTVQPFSQLNVDKFKGDSRRWHL